MSHRTSETIFKGLEELLRQSERANQSWRHADFRELELCLVSVMRESLDLQINLKKYLTEEDL